MQVKAINEKNEATNFKNGKKRYMGVFERKGGNEK